MLLFLAALAVACGLRFSFRTSKRARPSVRLVALPILAVAMQAALGVPPLHRLDANGHFAVVLLSYAVVGIWLFVNAIGQMPPLRLPAGLIFCGWLTNVIAIVANRGMPVSRWALAEIGVRHPSVANGNLYKHVLASTHTVLPWLGDAIPVAFPVLRNVISIGDVLIVVGAMLAVRHLELAPLEKARRDTMARPRDVVFQVPNPP